MRWYRTGVAAALNALLTRANAQRSAPVPGSSSSSSKTWIRNSTGSLEMGDASMAANVNERVTEFGDGEPEELPMRPVLYRLAIDNARVFGIDCMLAVYALVP
jgi:hypothetical protein